VACGTNDDVRTLKLTEDFGRDINLAIATNNALKLFLNYIKEIQSAEETAAETL
jgi:nicotinamide-nucleotide amidase